MIEKEKKAGIRRTTLNPYDELNIVQSIITTQEELSFKVGSWTIGLITALTIAVFHKDTTLPWDVYLMASIMIIGIFFYVSLDHWETFKKATYRSKIIENEIKQDTYTIPRINKALKRDKASKNLNIFKWFIEEAVIFRIRLSCVSFRFYGLYALLLVIVLWCAFSAKEQKNHKKSQVPITFNIDHNTQDFELIIKKVDR